MKGNMSITEEIQAILAGNLPCSEQKRAICVAYCKRRTEAMAKLMNSADSKSAIAEHLPNMQEKTAIYSKFITWAETQSGGAK